MATLLRDTWGPSLSPPPMRKRPCHRRRYSPSDAGSRSFLVTLKTVGTQSISATDGTLSASQPGISVIAGSAAQLVVSGALSPIAAGQATSVTVEARDAWSNRATTYAGTVSFSSTD